MQAQQLAIVGAGIFGAGAAVSLAARGHKVHLFDPWPGPLPHPLAASTDISKVVRIEYGADEVYMALGERAVRGWQDWNERFPSPVYHQVGLLMISLAEMAQGGFEYESYHLLRRRGHHPERVREEDLRRRFPAWNAARYPDGFYHSIGGYAEAKKTVQYLLEEAVRRGVVIHEGERVAGLLERSSGPAVVTERGAHPADQVIVTAGSWTGKLLPELAADLRPFAQPVFHLRPVQLDLYRAARFPVFTSDIARQGYYGFPVNWDGIVKIAHHGPGKAMDPDDPARIPDPQQEAALREFLRESLPGLHGAPLVASHLCLYSDTWDGHFWIDRHPQRAGVVVAAGGSGHAFKFAPLLGDLIADVTEDRQGPAPDDALRTRFRWRPDRRHVPSEEAARLSVRPLAKV